MFDRATAKELKQTSREIVKLQKSPLDQKKRSDLPSEKDSHQQAPALTLSPTLPQIPVKYTKSPSSYADRLAPEVKAIASSL
jgi:hypothetical protein